MPGETEVTSAQVVAAAKALGAEFTRDELAERLGVKRQQLRRGVRQAKRAGLLEKTRDDDEGTSHFRLTAEAR